MTRHLRESLLVKENLSHADGGVGSFASMIVKKTR